MQLRTKQLLIILGGVCFSLAVRGEDTANVNLFSLRCGHPVTEFIFIDQTEGLERWDDVSVDQVDLLNFDRKLVIRQIQALYRSQYEPLVIIPVRHFSYKGIDRIVKRLLIREYLLSNEENVRDSWCTNIDVLRKHVQQESVERGMQLEFKEPIG